MAEKILIIDDDVDTLKLVGMMLEKQGYQILAASSGEQGLTLAEAENPDLVLLDVMMPEMDGYEVARRLRANPLTATTPILMFTAKTQLDDKVTGFEAGADDYLTKPTHPSELSAHVKALLGRSSKGKVSTGPLPSERRATTIGVIAPRGGQGVTTVAVNIGDALRLTTEKDVIVAELRPGMGTLGPAMGENDPTVMNEFLSANLSDITRQKILEKIYMHKGGLRLMYGTTQPKDGLLANTPAVMEMLASRMSYLAPYLVLDLGAGLSAINQKLIPTCHFILVLVEPVSDASIRHSRALIDNIIEMTGNRKNIFGLVVNRVRSDTQVGISQIEALLGRAPLLAVTPAPELIYAAIRVKNTAFSTRPDSLTNQQFTSLAGMLLGFEKDQRR
jgi:DNA-binding response OmpR family regulator/CO dehydrogenase nickel-insertion accessory protein CooC1